MPCVPTQPPDGPQDPTACPGRDGGEPERSDAPYGEDSGRTWQGFGTRPPGEGLTNRCVHISACIWPHAYVNVKTGALITADAASMSKD